MRIFIDWFNRVWKRPPNKIEAELLTPAPDERRIAELTAWIAGSLELFEQLLAEHDYLFGNDFSAADCAACRCTRRRARAREPQLHTIQCVEAAVSQHGLLRGTDEAGLPLIAAARYLAAHASTTRSQRQTCEIARRLHRGERLYEDEPA